MSEEDTEVQETESSELSTQVGDFRKVQQIDDGASWTVPIATSIFYQFIIPTTRPLALQKNIQDGLTAWLASKDEWIPEIVGEKIKFNPDTFRQINQEALNKLLNSKLIELQENPDKYTDATYKVVDEQGNETGETKKIPFGYNLQNPKGFSISETAEEDAKESRTYKEWLKIINDGKVEIDALSTEKKKAKGKIKDALNSKINDMKEAVAQAEEIIEQMKNFTYNDEVTLKEVVQNTKDAQRFYLRMSFDPDDPKVAIALGNLIGEEYGTWEENQDLFEETFGVSWKDYQDEMKEKQDKYLSQLGLSNKIKDALSSNEGLEMSIDELIDTFDIEFPLSITEFKTPKQTRIELNEEQGGSSLREVEEERESYAAELDNKEELSEWLNTTEDEESIEKLLDRIVSKSVRQINLFAKGSGTQIKLTEPRKPQEDVSGKRVEFYDKPQRMSKDDISNYII